MEGKERTTLCINSFIPPAHFSRVRLALVSGRQEVLRLLEELFIDFFFHLGQQVVILSVFLALAHFLINRSIATLSMPQQRYNRQDTFFFPLPSLKVVEMIYVGPWANSGESVSWSHTDQNQWGSSKDQAERQKHKADVTGGVLSGRNIQSALLRTRLSNKQLQLWLQKDAVF